MYVLCLTEEEAKYHLDAIFDRAKQGDLVIVDRGDHRVRITLQPADEYANEPPLQYLSEWKVRHSSHLRDPWEAVDESPDSVMNSD